MFIGTMLVAYPMLSLTRTNVSLATSRLLVRCQWIASLKRSFHTGLVFLGLRTCHFLISPTSQTENR